MKKFYSFLFIIIVVFIYFSSKNDIVIFGEKHILTMSGKTDPRLDLMFEVLYQPINENQHQDCKERDLMVLPEYDNIIVRSRREYFFVENKKDYKIDIPFYSTKKINNCDFELKGIKLTVFRNKDHSSIKDYGSIPILNKTIFQSFVQKGSGLDHYDFLVINFYKQTMNKFVDGHLFEENKEKMTSLSFPGNQYFKISSNQTLHCPTSEIETDDLNFVEFGCYLYKSNNEIIEKVNNDYSIVLNILPDDASSNYEFRNNNLTLSRYKKGLLTKEQENLFISKQGKFSNLEENKFSFF